MNVSRFAHVLNAALWAGNTIVWTFYTGSLVMGAASVAATVLSIWLAMPE